MGAPSRLLLDNAKSETSKVVKDILQLYGIKGMQSEANHQHQNYAERRIQEVKSTANIIMDRVNAPDSLWYLCLKYVVMVLNHLATPSLKNRTPIEKAFGVSNRNIQVTSVLLLPTYFLLGYQQTIVPSV